MSKINTTPDLYDDSVDNQDEPMTQDEILKNEGDILADLLSLEQEADRPENYRTIRIKRGKKVKLAFRIRPITESESRTCIKRATPTVRNKNVKPETDWVKYRSLMLYTATVDEDRRKIWDNKDAIQKMNVMEGWEIIDKVIFAGEKSRILEIIDEISGFDDELEETAGN